MDVTPPSSGLISFSGRVSIVGTRKKSQTVTSRISRASPRRLSLMGTSGNKQVVPWKDAFLRLKADVISIHKDKEHNQLLMPPFSTENMLLAKRKDNEFKIYFRIGSLNSVLRLRIEDNMASAFSFLLRESWALSKRGEWSERLGEEWEALLKGCIRSVEEDWRKASIMLANSHLFILFDDGGSNEKIDLRKVVSCRSVSDQRECCAQCCVEKKELERECIYSIALNLSNAQVVWIDSGEMKAVSTLRSIINRLTE